MARRLIFGPILVLLLLGAVVLDDYVTSRAISHPWARGLVLMGIAMLVCAVGGIELARMFNALGVRASRKHLAFASAAGVLVGGFTIGRPAPGIFPPDLATAIQATASAAVVFLSMLAYIRDRNLKGAAAAVAAAVFAFVYMGVVIGFLMAILREHGPWVMVAVVMTIKSSDIGAYFTGVAVGKHKLIPWISPGKTWEGFAGGIVTAAGVATVTLLAAQAWAPPGAAPPMPWWFAALLGVVLGAAGQAGDLSASVIKRDAGVKDAGRALPGFGGVVDMLDSLVVAAAVGYWGLALARLWW